MFAFSPFKGSWRSTRLQLANVSFFLSNQIVKHATSGPSAFVGRAPNRKEEREVRWCIMPKPSKNKREKPCWSVHKTKPAKKQYNVVLRKQTATFSEIPYLLDDKVTPQA